MVAVAIAFALWPLAASAHQERVTHFPPGTGQVPAYRQAGPRLLVCGSDRADFEKRIAGFSSELQATNRQLFQECQARGYPNLQDAVDAVTAAGTTIAVLPGLYQEQPSLTPPGPDCGNLKAPRARLGYLILTYEQQRACPHLQNLVAIFGVHDLQIEGTGAGPGDVVFDAQFQKLNTLRADRSDGVYFRNFTTERATFNALYILETDGFAIDQVVGRWNAEYGFLTFASDHGLYTKCEAYGNGDSGVYPGGTSDINKGRGFDVPRYAIEVTGCHSHDNMLGYSGTGGDSVWAHDNVFDHNQTGVSMDSLFPNHPGLPQNHALFEHNVIASNNANYYGYVRDGTCHKPYAEQGIERGVVCPAVGVPVGVAAVVAGGDYDQFRDNFVYDNWRGGFVMLWVPGADLEWTSNSNRFLGNHMGVDAGGGQLPNGVDFWWDGQGRGNCWDGGGPSGSTPMALPGCSAGDWGPSRLLADPNKEGLIADCSNYSLASSTLPPLCDWWDTPGRPGQVAPSLWTVQLIGPLLQLLAVFGLVVAVGRRRRLAAAWSLGVLVPLLLLVLGSADQLRGLAVAGEVLFGLWLLAVARPLGGRLGWLSVALGVVFLAEALDSALVMIPLLPVGPVWIRLLLELVWLGAMAAAVGARLAPPSDPLRLTEQT